MVEAAEKQVVVWAPQGPQAAFIHCPTFDVLFGGARGGGKSDAVLGEFALHASRYGKNASGVIIRREMPQADSLIERSQQVFRPVGAEWQEVRRQWVFPDGATLKFRPLEADRDAEKYQGQQFTRVYVEELTNFHDPKPIDKMKATLRSAQGVPARFRATTNPGGPGHTWVKRRYVDPAPMGYTLLPDETGAKARIFIPSKVWDNKILLANDPGYPERLRLSGSAALVKAWLEGDWTAVEGAFFDCFSADKHIIPPFDIPGHWLRFRSMDWGSASPFSVGWWAVVSDDQNLDDGRILPRGSLVRYREWYGATAELKGIKMSAEDVAKGVKLREMSDKISYGVLDPSAFRQDGGPSIAERMIREGLVWQPADNRRIAQLGAIGGWDMMRHRLIGNDSGQAMLYVFDSCVDFIRTVPVLQHDPDRIEDVDTDAEDHVADEARYACMSRPWIKEAPKKPKPMTTLQDVTMEQLWELHRKEKQGERI